MAEGPKIGVNTGNRGMGRPKGAANKTTTAAKEAFILAFDRIGGVERLATWAEDNQTEFFKLYSKLIPVDVNAKGEFNGRLEISWKPPEG